MNKNHDSHLLHDFGVGHIGNSESRWSVRGRRRQALGDQSSLATDGQNRPTALPGESCLLACISKMTHLPFLATSLPGSTPQVSKKPHKSPLYGQRTPKVTAQETGRTDGRKDGQIFLPILSGHLCKKQR